MNYEVYEKIRISKGFSNAYVAKECGFGQSTFSDWKSGRSEPKEAKLEKIANVLGVTTFELRNGTKPEVPSFDPRHIELIDMFSRLTEEQQEHIFNTMKLLLSGK